MDIAAPGSRLQCSRSDANWSRWGSSVRYIEYRIVGETCACGRAQRSTFSVGIEAPVQYGPGVSAFVVYMTQYQLLPYQRTAEVLNELAGLGISPGTLQRTVHCGSPGAARSARRDGRRTNVSRRRPWPPPDFLHPKSDGSHFGFRKKWRRSGIRESRPVFGHLVELAYHPYHATLS